MYEIFITFYTNLVVLQYRFYYLLIKVLMEISNNLLTVRSSAKGITRKRRKIASREVVAHKYHMLLFT